MAAPLEARNQQVRRVLAWTLVLNLAVAFGKIVAGLAAGSLTVLADGFHSLLDGTNNIVALVALRFAMMPADEDHPYGHRKFEHVAAIGIGAMVALLFWETVRQALGRLSAAWHGTGTASSGPHHFDTLAAVVLALTLVINIGVATWERREGKRLQSPILTADSTHTFSDTFITTLSFLSLALAGRLPLADPILSIGVSIFLLHAAWSILRDNIATMTDRSRLDPEEVRGIAEAIPGVSGAHAIRSHGMENDIHLDLHIVVPSELSAGDVTRIEDAVADALQERFPAVTLVNVRHEVEEPEAAEPVWKLR